jgi:LPS sulfotransferase NodH
MDSRAQIRNEVLVKLPKDNMTRVKLTKALTELKLQNLMLNQPWGFICDEGFRSLFEEWGIDPKKLIAVEDVVTVVDNHASPKVLVVCTEKPEGQIQKHLREHDVHTLGLFSQLIPRLAAGLPPRYNARAAETAKLEYAIMCLPRCGSTLVSRELKLIGAGNPVEHFRGYVQDLLREREVSRFDFPRWWSMVRGGHIENGVFGTKIIYDFWKMAERFMLPEEISEITSFLAKVPIVYIERSDKYSQAVSDTVARQTGVWHLWSNNMKEAYAQKLEGLNGNLQEAMISYKKFRRNERELRDFLEKIGSRVIKIEYEDLVTEPKLAIRRAAEQLGLDVPEGYITSEVALQPTTSEAHRALRDRLKEELR